MQHGHSPPPPPQSAALPEVATDPAYAVPRSTQATAFSDNPPAPAHGVHTARESCATAAPSQDRRTTADAPRPVHRTDGRTPWAASGPFLPVAATPSAAEYETPAPGRLRRGAPSQTSTAPAAKPHLQSPRSADRTYPESPPAPIANSDCRAATGRSKESDTRYATPESPPTTAPTQPAMPPAPLLHRKNHAAAATRQPSAETLRIQQRDAHLSPRERLVQHRQIPDHQRDKPQSHASLGDHQGSRQRAARQHVAQSQRPQRRPAHIQVRAEPCPRTRARTYNRVGKRRSHCEEEQREADDQQQRPQRQQQQQRQGPIHAVALFPRLLASHPLGHRRPRRPRRGKEDAGNLKPSRRSPRQDNRLKRIQRHSQTAQHPGNESGSMQTKSLYSFRLERLPIANGPRLAFTIAERRNWRLVGGFLPSASQNLLSASHFFLFSVLG